MRKKSKKEQTSRAIFGGLVFLAILLGVGLLTVCFPKIDPINVESHKNLFFTDPSNNIVLGASISQFKEISKLARFDISYAISDLGEIYIDQKLFYTIDVFTPTGELKQIIRNKDLARHHGLYFDLDHYAIYATHYRYPLDPSTLDPSHYAVTKYSTLTNSIEYSIPQWNILGEFLSSYLEINGTEYRFKYIKGFTPEGNTLIVAEEMIDEKKREFQTEGGIKIFYPTVEVTIPQLYFVEGDLTVQDTEDTAGTLVGFDEKGNRYNHLVSKGTLMKVDTNGSIEEFPTNWTQQTGKLLGVDSLGYFYYLKYNENSSSATFLKYNNSLELMNSMEVSIPYNDRGYGSGYMGEGELKEAIWGEPFISKDGTIYYSFIEPEKDLWSIKKFSFPEESMFEFELNEEVASDYKTYSDESITFEYPAILTLTKDVEQDKTQIHLSHSIDFNHESSCNLSGDGTVLSELEDFSMYIELYDGNLEKTISESRLKEILEEIVNKEKNELILKSDFIDAYETETLKGYRMLLSFEGCGEFVYFFPLSDKKTLVVDDVWMSPPVSEIDLENPSKKLYEIKESVMGKDFFEDIFSSIQVKI